MTFFSYINRRGLLVVKRFLSPTEVQESRPLMRRYIGQFEAPDPLQARRIAQEMSK